MVPGESRAREEARAVGWLGTASPWRIGVHSRRARKGAVPRGEVERVGGGRVGRTQCRGGGLAGRAARGRRPRTRPALDRGGERAERRERIRGLIQNSNFSQRFFLEHEKL